MVMSSLPQVPVMWNPKKLEKHTKLVVGPDYELEKIMAAEKKKAKQGK